ncbi:MAG: molybdopterin-dependent oxidoreductase, partial [Alphaproteobacteria bacterium]
MTSDTFRHSSHWGAFTAEVEDGRLTGVRPFVNDPSPSALIHSIPEAVHDESRVARPSIRKGWLDRAAGGHPENRGIDPFVEVPWDEALDLVSGELSRVRDKFGNEAIFGGSYGWASAGRFHHAKSQLQRFLNTIGGFTGSVHTYSIAAGYAILPHVLGSARAAMTEATSWDSIVENTELVVAFGGIPAKNLQVSAGGPGEHTSGAYLKAAREAGVAFVNISPIRNDMADHLGAEWLAIRPNTDMALMLALAHTLETEGLADRDFLSRYCTGYERFRAYLLGETDGFAKSAAWAAPICEIDQQTIVSLARRMAGARTLINTNWSLQRGDHGEQPFWMTVTLAAMLGGIGLPGQGFGFGYGSMGNVGNPRRPAPTPTLSTGDNLCDSWIPVARIADMLLHPGAAYEFNGETRTYPDIRLVYWSGGNPFHHHQDLNRLVRAWRRPDTVIVNEPWWTATAKFS